MVFNCHFLSFQENLTQTHRHGINVHIWSLERVYDWSITNSKQTSFMILAAFLSLNSNWAMASSMLIPWIFWQQRKKKCYCWTLGVTLRSLSYHFGQVPHLVFAVLDLPPAVINLLKRRAKNCLESTPLRQLQPSRRSTRTNSHWSVKMIPVVAETHCWSAGFIWKLWGKHLLVLPLPILGFQSTASVETCQLLWTTTENLEPGRTFKKEKKKKM